MRRRPTQPRQEPRRTPRPRRRPMPKNPFTRGAAGKKLIAEQKAVLKKFEEAREARKKFNAAKPKAPSLPKRKRRGRPPTTEEIRLTPVAPKPKTTGKAPIRAATRKPTPDPKPVTVKAPPPPKPKRRRTHGDPMPELSAAEKIRRKRREAGRRRKELQENRRAVGSIKRLQEIKKAREERRIKSKPKTPRKGFFFGRGRPSRRSTTSEPSPVKRIAKAVRARRFQARRTR